jgi:hypothetical protein
MACETEVSEPIAREAAGTADETQLNLLIAEAWRAALNEAGDKAEIAALLGVPASELDPRQPPFRASIGGAGLTGAEVLIALGTGFLLGVAKEIGGAAGKSASKKLRELWTTYLRDRVSPPGSGKLGPPGYSEDED